MSNMLSQFERYAVNQYLIQRFSTVESNRYSDPGIVILITSNTVYSWFIFKFKWQCGMYIIVRGYIMGGFV